MCARRVVGYARLVDAGGRIRWLAQGMVTKQEITDMIALAHSLLTDTSEAAAAGHAGSLAEIESRKFDGGGGADRAAAVPPAARQQAATAAAAGVRSKPNPRGRQPRGKHKRG